MDYDELMERLKDFTPADFPFVTQYVNAHWTEEFHKKRTSLFFKNEWNGVFQRFREQDAPNDVLRSLRRDRDRIEEHLRDAMRGTVEAGSQGLAYFASAGSGFFEVFPASASFDDQLVVADVPYLKQLARLADEYERLLLVMVDAGRARIYELELAGVDSYVTVLEDVPGRHKQGGPSQLRFQRHVDVHHGWHYRDVARAAERLFDRRRIGDVVMAGQPEVIAEFSRFLPKRILERVFVTVHLDLIEPENVVLRKVLQHLHRHEHDKERRGVRRAINQAAVGGKGTVGLLATLRAVNSRAVQVLYLGKGFAATGVRCTNCGLLSPPAGECPHCSGDVREVELSEEMANDVLETGGEIDIVEENDELASFEGVAAATRFRKPTIVR